MIDLHAMLAKYTILFKEWENTLILGSLGALESSFRDLVSKLIVFGKQAALQKSFNKNLTWKEKPSFRLILFFKKSSASGGKPPDPLQ